MHQILRTAEFDQWLGGMRDRIGRKLVTARIDRLAHGHWGDCQPVGGEVTELRVHSGPGYRVYCWQDGPVVILMLAGGDKSTQDRDIARAQAMVKALKE
jgi:putative addiction module killer protein